MKLRRNGKKKKGPCPGNQVKNMFQDRDLIVSNVADT